VTPTKSKTASTWHVMPSTDGRSSSVAISGSF
jgi:hypothetical protein